MRRLASPRLRLRLTTSGVLYVLLTLSLGFAAVNTGNNLLYLVVSVLLGFMSLSGWLGHNNLKRLKPSLTLPEEVYAETPVLAALRVENGKKRWPSFLLELVCGSSNARLGGVPAGAAAECYLTLSFPQRGAQPFPQVSIASPFPVHFFIRRWQLTPPGELVVLPRPRPDGERPAAWGERGSHAPQALRPAEEGDYSHLRPYGGEPQRRIHWRQSARQDNLLSKVLSGEAAQPLLLEVLALPGADLEEKLGRAVWWVQRCDRRHQPIGLQLGAERIPAGSGPGHRRRLLEALACYAP